MINELLFPTLLTFGVVQQRTEPRLTGRAGMNGGPPRHTAGFRFAQQRAIIRDNFGGDKKLDPIKKL
jgi:hypothetical protein